MMCPSDLETIIQSCKQIAASKSAEPEFETWIGRKIIDLGMRAFAMSPNLDATSNNRMLCITGSQRIHDAISATEGHRLVSVFPEGVNPFNESEGKNVVFKKFITILIDRASKKAQDHETMLSTPFLTAFIQESSILLAREACINIYNIKSADDFFSMLDLPRKISDAGYSLVNASKEGTVSNHVSFVNPLARQFIDLGLVMVDIHVSEQVVPNQILPLLALLESALLKS